MRESFVIARREFLERVRSKWFVVMTILGPIMMVAMIVVPALLAGRGLSGAKVRIVDKSGKIGEPLKEALTASLQWHVEIVPPTTPESELLSKIRDKQINGFMVIPEDVLTEKAVMITYKGDNASNQIVGIVLQRTLNQIVIAARAKEADVPQDKIDRILAAVEVLPIHTTGEAEGKSGIASFFLGYILGFILYFTITLYGINVLRSVVVEKSSRVVELMVAASKPRSLMAGKIGGVGAAGLVQVAVWLTMGAITLTYKTQILHALGGKSDGMSLPALSAGVVAVVIAFFVLGFVFYSAMYAAVGAMVSSDQDSQQAAVPITMFLIAGVVCMSMITNDPRGSTAATITMIPFWSPTLMPLRYFLGGATLGEVFLSMGILIVATVVVARAAAKIYRVGILMYGKRPGLGEIIRWLRH
jgi:ABC-2 type transport system permease protein